MQKGRKIMRPMQVYIVLLTEKNRLNRHFTHLFAFYLFAFYLLKMRSFGTFASQSFIQIRGKFNG